MSVLSQLKSIPPKAWIIMGGALVVMLVLANRNKSGNAVISQAQGSSTDESTSLTTDAINSLRSQLASSNDKMNEIQKGFINTLNDQSDMFNDKLNKQQETMQKGIETLTQSFGNTLTSVQTANDKRFSEQSTQFSSMMESLKSSFTNTTNTLATTITSLQNQVQKTPNYDARFAEYDSKLQAVQQSNEQLRQQTAVNVQPSAPTSGPRPLPDMSYGWGSSSGTVTKVATNISTTDKIVPPVRVKRIIENAS